MDYEYSWYPWFIEPTCQLSLYIASVRPQQKTPFPSNSPIVIEVCLPRHCIETAVLLWLLAYSFPREPVYQSRCLAITAPLAPRFRLSGVLPNTVYDTSSNSTMNVTKLNQFSDVASRFAQRLRFRLALRIICRDTDYPAWLSGAFLSRCRQMPGRSSIRPQLLHFKSFQVHHLSIIIPLDSMSPRYQERRQTLEKTLARTHTSSTAIWNLNISERSSSQ
jgi:hypothetical protein